MFKHDPKEANGGMHVETPNDSTAIVKSWPSWKQEILGGIGYVTSVSSSQSAKDSGNKSNNGKK